MNHNSKVFKRIINKNSDKFDTIRPEAAPVTNNEDFKPPPIKYGPMPSFAYQKVWTRMVLIISIIAIVWFTSRGKKETVLASRKEILQHRGQSFQCSDSFQKEIENYPKCVPTKCGRFMTDKLITASEAEALFKLARHGIAFGGSEGGASILDLHSGALSYGKKFVNVYTFENLDKIFHPADITLYKIIKTKIHHAVAHNFGLHVNSIYLTHPTFFSKLTNVDPVSLHDEYWHPHVDKDTYESFHYTSLLYLNDYGDEYTGGRFIFMDSNKNVTLEPRRGRVLMFSSGEENVHFVERVTSGTRYAITISFTCDVSKAIADPILKKK